MNISNPPINNPKLLVLYLWKIIDLPYITFNDLLFKISYDLFILPPDKAEEFINSCIKNKLIDVIEENKLTLSNSLNKELKDWQRLRKNQIQDQINSTEKINQIKTAYEKGKSTNFSNYFKSLVEKETLNRAARVKNEDFNIEELDFKLGSIKATIKGSKDHPYIIEIDLKNKHIKHDCHDFETRRSKSKLFCKHLAKFFLLLRESHKTSTEQFLMNISENIEEWDFFS